jgi:hypothetical protein
MSTLFLLGALFVKPQGLMNTRWQPSREVTTPFTSDNRSCQIEATQCIGFQVSSCDRHTEYCVNFREDYDTYFRTFSLCLHTSVNLL